MKTFGCMALVLGLAALAACIPASDAAESVAADGGASGRPASTTVSPDTAAAAAIVSQCPKGSRVTRPRGFEWSAMLAGVRVGWSSKRLRKHAGDPTECAGRKWTYVAGHPDGPQATYTFTVERGIVTAIRKSSFACRI